MYKKPTNESQPAANIKMLMWTTSRTTTPKVKQKSAADYIGSHLFERFKEATVHHDAKNGDDDTDDDDDSKLRKESDAKKENENGRNNARATFYCCNTMESF